MCRDLMYLLSKVKLSVYVPSRRGCLREKISIQSTEIDDIARLQSEENYS